MLYSTVKKHSKNHKPATVQSGKASSQDDTYVAVVPVKISIEAGETVLEEYAHGMRNELTRRKLLAEEEKKASNGKELCHFPRRRSLYV